MWESCVLTLSSYEDIKRSFPSDSPCNHCVYHKYGCPNIKTFTVGSQKYIPIEQSLDELPKCGIWCRNCKKNSGKIFHETFWNRLKAFAIRCSQCKEEFFMYAYKVRAKYTGFVNKDGEFVAPDLYGSRNLKKESESARKLAELHKRSTDIVVYSTKTEKASTAMELAMKKAGIL